MMWFIVVIQVEFSFEKKPLKATMERVEFLISEMLFIRPITPPMSRICLSEANR